MSGIEIGLLLAIICLGIWNIILGTMLDKKEPVSNISSNFRVLQSDFNRLQRECETKSDILSNELGLGDYYNYKYRSFKHTTNQRINLLMDHLNLEIKEGEPSKTTLVKKKPVKRSK